MQVTIQPALTARLNQLANLGSTIKDEVIPQVAAAGMVTMHEVIQTDEDANASGYTGAKTPWHPQGGRRELKNTMDNTLDMHPTENGMLVGWQNATDYIEGQDEGWGSGGNAPMPEGALYKNVEGAEFVQAGYEAITDVLPAQLEQAIRRK
jgi:hypothetical protein